MLRKSALRQIFLTVVRVGAMSREHARPRDGVAKFPSGGEGIFVTTWLKKICPAADFFITCNLRQFIYITYMQTLRKKKGSSSSHIVGVYHKDCTDGTTAAAVLLKRHPRAMVFPISFDHDVAHLAHILSFINNATTVYVLDCTANIDSFLEHAERVVAIDHHADARERMEALARENEKFTYIFRNDRSGAGLAWEYFFPKTGMPRIVKLVQDGDLWEWKYGKATAYARAYLATLFDQPEKVKKLLSGEAASVALKIGKLYSLYEGALIRSFIEKNEPIYLRIGTHTMPAFNTRLHEDELGNYYSEKLESAVVIFRIRGPQVAFSIRSHDGQTPSAQTLAKTLGGGGHRNSSGARVPLKEFLKMVVTEPPSLDSPKTPSPLHQKISA